MDESIWDQPLTITDDCDGWEDTSCDRMHRISVMSNGHVWVHPSTSVVMLECERCHCRLYGVNGRKVCPYGEV